eukprot:COSAG01_NODE_4612_length_4878_cov_15.581502_5_plen_54_part_00
MADTMGSRGSSCAGRRQQAQVRSLLSDSLGFCRPCLGPIAAVAVMAVSFASKV